MHIEPEISGAAIVLLGSFNPKIFQPYWFARNGLISDEAADAAQVSIIHPEVTGFVLESEFNLNVNRDRFTIDRSVAPLITICDLVVRTFGDLLPHTPITSVGINRLVHFDVGDIKKRDRIGDLLAPKAPWGEWGKQISSGDGAKHGGLLSLTMIQNVLSDRAAGSIQTRIEPSSKIRSGRTGIFMEVNDHYQLTETIGQDSHEIIGILQAKFDGSMKTSEGIIDQIMGLVHE